jgi:uncharacterized iron-regulated membrane protein
VLTLAGTGAIWIFKDELEPLLHRAQLVVSPAAERVSLDRLVATARQYTKRQYGTDRYVVNRIEVPSRDDRSIAVFLRGPRKAHCRVFLDPYRGTALGEITDASFFPIVLRLHRTLFAGTCGRLLTELGTCWTMVLLASGIYLWWPRGNPAKGAVWWPRWRRNPRATLRDLHAVTGFWIAAVAALMAFTGLLYAFVWGTAYHRLTGGNNNVLAPPAVPPSTQSVSDPLETVLRRVQGKYPGSNLGILVPKKAQTAHVVVVHNSRGPSILSVVAVDPRDGAVMADDRLSDMPILAQWANWNYPLHAGSVLGIWSKVLWLGACLGLMTMPITGCWMWWQRKPKGQLGLPGYVPIKLRAPWLIAAAAVGIFLPLVGLSGLAFLFIDRTRHRGNQ